MKPKRKQIGVVGVDSGQLMVCDPCYIEGEWKHKARSGIEFPPGDLFESKDGKKWRCAMHAGVNDERGGINLFQHFEMPIEEFGGKTPNELLASGEWKRVPKPPVKPQEFSYNGCCTLTLGEESAGQMKYKAGHDGAGVAFASGYGDGVYPVFAHYNKDGRITKVEIIMN